MDDEPDTITDPRVAGVLADLQQLDDLAVDQHVAVFELTHAKLRGLLTEQGHLPSPPAVPGASATA